LSEYRKQKLVKTSYYIYAIISHVKTKSLIDANIRMKLNDLREGKEVLIMLMMFIE
jgi:hypothetical protein